MLLENEFPNPNAEFRPIPNPDMLHREKHNIKSGQPLHFYSNMSLHLFAS